MEESLRWVWIAFSAAWVVYLVYVYSLGSRQKDLKQQAEELHALIDSRASR